jgi:hypothetical protein
MVFLSGQYNLRIVGVLGIDSILSDDTAVAAMAARRLQGRQRRQAIIRDATGTSACATARTALIPERNKRLR